MSKFRILTISAYTLLAMGACTSNSDSPVPSPTPAEKLPLSISTSLASRVTDDNFELGDNIGLFMVYRNEDGSASSLKLKGNYLDNCPYTYRGYWVANSTNYWKDNTTHADFYAYYPYTPTLTSVEAMPWSVNTDQSQLANYKAGDLLIGKTLDVTPTGNNVKIETKHAMSQILITLAAGNGFTNASLAAADAKVKVNHVKTQATADISTGIITATGKEADIIPLHEDNLYKALIIPQDISEGNLITVNVDGRDFNLPKASNFHAFETGKRYTFTVTLSKTSNGVNVSITKWKDDGIDYGGTAE